MKRVILDTNFLMIPFTQGIDVFEEIDRIILDEYEVFVLDGSIDELNKIIEEQKGKHKRTAKMALGLAEKCSLLKQKDLNINTDSSRVDDILVSLASKDTIIATQDKELKRRLKDNPIITTYGKTLAVKDVL